MKLTLAIFIFAFLQIKTKLVTLNTQLGITMDFVVQYRDDNNKICCRPTENSQISLEKNNEQLYLKMNQGEWDGCSGYNAEDLASQVTFTEVNSVYSSTSIMNQYDKAISWEWSLNFLEVLDFDSEIQGDVFINVTVNQEQVICSWILTAQKLQPVTLESNCLKENFYFYNPFSQAYFNEDSNSLWQFRETKEKNLYEISQSQTQKYLGVDSLNHEITLISKIGEPDPQLWQIKRDREGTYYLVHSSTDLYLGSQGNLKPDNLIVNMTSIDSKIFSFIVDPTNLEDSCNLISKQFEAEASLEMKKGSVVVSPEVPYYGGYDYNGFSSKLWPKIMLPIFSLSVIPFFFLCVSIRKKRQNGKDRNLKIYSAMVGGAIFGTLLVLLAVGLGGAAIDQCTV